MQGFLDADEVRQAIVDLQISITPDEVGDMIKNCDTNGDGETSVQRHREDRRASLS